MSLYLEKAEKVRAITEYHVNCAQALVTTFADVMGIDEETAMRMAANFGAGMKMGATCGAITGALMVLGLAGIDDVEVLRRVYASVKENHEGKLDCRDLLALNAKTGRPRKQHCDGMVYELTALTEEILRENGKL